jgi:hypothetical protein
MLLPCRVDEMTEREAEIFKVAAYHLGFIQFLRTALPDQGTDAGQKSYVQEEHSK